MKKYMWTMTGMKERNVLGGPALFLHENDVDKLLFATDGLVSILEACVDTIESGLETTGKHEADWSKADRKIVEQARLAIKKATQ